MCIISLAAIVALVFPVVLTYNTSPLVGLDGSLRSSKQRQMDNTSLPCDVLSSAINANWGVSSRHLRKSSLTRFAAMLIILFWTPLLVYCAFCDPLMRSTMCGKMFLFLLRFFVATLCITHSTTPKKLISKQNSYLKFGKKEFMFFCDDILQN